MESNPYKSPRALSEPGQQAETPSSRWKAFWSGARRGAKFGGIVGLAIMGSIVVVGGGIMLSDRANALDLQLILQHRGTCFQR